MTNPLLEQHPLPPFSAIEVAHIVPAISELIARNKRAITELLDNSEQHDWDSLLQPIEALEDELAQAWSPVGHLNGVMNSDELREAYNTCITMMSEYGTWLGQNEALYEAYREIAASEAFTGYCAARQAAINHALRDFTLAGVALSADRKARFADVKKRLSELGSKFSENVLDATNAWSKHFSSAAELPGLPESALASARQAAERAGKPGYLINLEFPSWYPVLTYCEDASLREEVYIANSTRASEQGPHAGQWDNAPLIEEILALRQEMAEMLGLADFSEYSLATKMADSPDRVMVFLNDLAERCHAQAQQEWQELVAFARDECGAQTVNAWDGTFYSEKLKQKKYQVSQEEIRPYLPVTRALPGLFEVAKRLYGVDIAEVADFDSYHPDVQLFDILQDGTTIARFYLDLYARADKRGGAWMDDCRVRRMTPGGLQIPVAYLVCNFTPPVGEQPSLLTDRELTTLFHEFGHGLHHMLTRQSVAAVSGINGVAWDAVELPSQFLENWCWEPEALAFISGHVDSGEPLPAELLEKMTAARNFQSAMAMMRQLEFSLFDFRLHREYARGGYSSVQALLDEIRQQVAVLIPPHYNRFQNSFTHIFGGGYAAGYYSYKWAEVLSADAFSRFEEEGIFNAETGRSFRENILEMGGSREPMELFVSFRGREPEIGPLLRHSGIAA
jgi:oligopeptidase A